MRPMALASMIRSDGRRSVLKASTMAASTHTMSSLFASGSRLTPTELSGSVAAIASKGVGVLAMGMIVVP